MCLTYLKCDKTLLAVILLAVSIYLFMFFLVLGFKNIELFPYTTSVFLTCDVMILAPQTVLVY